MGIFDKLKRLLGGGPPANDDAQSPEERAPALAREAPPAPVAVDAARAARTRKAAKPKTTRREERARAAGAEREALALEEGGDVSGAIALILASYSNLARHEEAGSLPCLCKRCLAPEVARAEVGGAVFFRDFALGGRRVLFYWAPEELRAQRGELRRSMKGAMSSWRRSADLARRARDAAKGPRINPFTKEPM